MLAQQIAQQAPKKYDSVFTCPRCDGKKYIKEFSHIKSGSCFLCGTTGTIDIKRPVNMKKYVISYEKMDNGTEYITVFANLREVFYKQINDANRIEMRAIWKWFVDNGAEKWIRTPDN